MVGLSMAERAAVLRAQERSGPRSVILIVMNGGPSQLETFDPKPDAPNYIRGPLRAIQTAIPGVRLERVCRSSRHVPTGFRSFARCIMRPRRRTKRACSCFVRDG